jgi:hypothetical protein
MSFNQGAPTVPTLINSSAVLVTGNAVSANALSVRQFGGGNCLSVSNANGTVGLFVSSTSNVGIGTTNPSSRLHVQGGDIYASSNINGNAGNTTWRLQPQYVGSNPFPSNFRIANGWDPIAGTGQANYAGVGINLNSYQGGSQIEFYTSATNNAVPTERMRIRTDGNVGIGTAGPQTALQVNGDLLLAQGTGNYGYNSLAIQYDGNTNYGSIIGKSVKWDGTNYIVQTDGVTPRCCAIQMSFDNGFKFVTTSASGGSNLTLSPAQFLSNTKVAITQGGSVGIGTTNPGSALHTAITSATATTIATFENYNTTTTTAKSFKLQFYGNGAGGQKDLGGITIVPTDGNFGYNDMAFSIRGPFGASSTEAVAEVMRFSKSGTTPCVGIGTANPIAPLHVEGNMVSCMSTAPRKVYSANWNVGASQAASSVVVNFANQGYWVKIILLISDAANAGNGMNCHSGEYVGGNIYGNTPPAIVALFANTNNRASSLQIGAVTLGTNAVTIAISAASASAGSMRILIEMVGSSGNVPSLTNVQYPSGTTVYTPGY